MDHIHSQRSRVKDMVFPVVMYGCESWTINKFFYFFIRISIRLVLSSDHHLACTALVTITEHPSLECPASQSHGSRGLYLLLTVALVEGRVCAHFTGGEVGSEGAP